MSAPFARKHQTLAEWKAQQKAQRHQWDHLDEVMERMFDDDGFATLVRAYAMWKLDSADTPDGVKEEYLDAAEFMIGLDNLIEGTSMNLLEEREREAREASKGGDL
jgi:hypothetical protein